MPWSDGWQQFYESASQQNQIDPALVTAIAISESGWNANGQNVNLGIDSNGTPGLPGNASGIGNATHRFYTYNNGLQAAQGLAAYLQTPLYGGSATGLFHDASSLLALMVGHGYSGCPGPECDAEWGNKILNIRAQVIGNGGNAPPFDPSNSGGLGGIPMPGGPTPPGTPQTPAQALAQNNPCATVQSDCSQWNAIDPRWIACNAWNAAAPMRELSCHVSSLIQWFTQRGHWWAIALVAAGVGMVVIGIGIYVKPDVNVQDIAAVAKAASEA